jgi:HlyD family secretion protein
MIGKIALPASGKALSLPRFRPLWILTALLLIAALAAGLIVARARGSVSYTTQPVVQQDLTQSVTASGTVNPQNTISVGTQVSGTIQAIYVDYNSKVKQGEVLARLDPSQMQAQLDQARAQLAQAQAQAAASTQSAASAQSGVTAAQATSAAQQANVQAAQAAIATADANVVKSQSALALAQQTVQRDKQLLSQGYIAQSQADTDQSNEVAAQTALKSAQAAAAQARAQAVASVNQAQASSAQTAQSSAQAAGSGDSVQAAQAAVAAAQAAVQQDELNLQHGVITSPVNGTVIARNVSVGQTVAASFQTPTLFSIAQDLKKMEVDISVGEPDIGNVRPGDPVSFSVLAYPNETFHGTVLQVRENPTMVNNVVTYTVITDVGNPHNELLPGMTANATIAVATAKNAIVVPLAALSWHPSNGSVHHRRTHTPTQTSTGGATTASPWGQTGAGVSGATSAGSTGLVFIQRSGKAVPVRVKVDLVSGTQAAVTPVRGTLTAGDAVIVSDSSQMAGASAQRSSSPMSGGPGGAGSIGRAIR